MCGIAGEIRNNGSQASSEAVARMTQVLAPRGPDASGHWSQDRIALGHRRLQIVDLSAHGQQPMVDPDLGLTICFNGMIYNYRELKEELEGQGYRFFSTSDTEVLLKAYHHWGQEFVQRLNGMFAFALVERDSGRVILGRDRLGIKPLYYSYLSDGLRFASTLPALLAAGEVDTNIDPVALHYYLHLHAVVPPPRTILKGARKLPPGTLKILEPDGRREEKRYWRLSMSSRPEDRGLTPEDWKALLREALERSVRRRMVADVPVGVLLSGGLDSSLIVGLLADQGQRRLNTFSIGFESVGDEAGDEFKYSDLVAQHFGTEHHKLRISPEETLEQLPNAINAMAEPMVSHDNIGFFLLSREVSRHVRVVQSGQGADEIFGGYHWYPPLLESSDPVGDYSRLFCDRDEAEFAETVADRFIGNDYSRELIRERFAEAGDCDAAARALWLDTTVMLVDDPVKRVDNQTMAWGLEARVPFLDHEVVELAARLPSRLKVDQGGKYILKELAREVIPSAVIDRPKGYFPVPALKYLRGEFLEMVREALSSQAARERALFKPHYVERLLADPEAHITPLRGSKLWQLGLLELWLQQHGV